jgi:CBS-domain-containing membrane protein
MGRTFVFPPASTGPVAFRVRSRDPKAVFTQGGRRKLSGGVSWRGGRKRSPTPPAYKSLFPLAQLRSSRAPRFSLRTTTCRDFLDCKKDSRHPNASHYFSCSPGDVVDDVKGSVKLKKQNVLPVIDPENRLVGVVTKGDLTNRDGVLVQDVMTTPPVTIFDSDHLHSALDLMRKYNLTRLPVIDNTHGRCIGMITHDEIVVPVDNGNLESLQRMESVDM